MSVTCRPGVMPATKTYLVRRLDSVEQEVTLLKKATGQECLERVSLRAGGRVGAGRTARCEDRCMLWGLSRNQYACVLRTLTHSTMVLIVARIFEWEYTLQ